MNFKYPYSNFHELNLDWLICEINKIKKQIEDLPDLDEKIKELEEMLADLEATLARSIDANIALLIFLKLLISNYPPHNK